MRQIESSNSAGNKRYYGPAPIPAPQPRSEQFYSPATMPPQQMRSEQFYGSMAAPQGSWPYYQPAPGVAQPRAAQPPTMQPARKTYTPNASKAQVRQRISSYKRRIVAVAFAGFGAIALLTGFSIHQSTSASTSSSASSSSSSSNNASSSNFFNQGGSSNVGSSSQPSSSGTTNS